MAEKRKIEQPEASESSEDEWVGPMPSEASKPKKVKVLPYESVYLSNLPSSKAYEKSFMHRDTVTHLAVSRTNFIITASCDGHIKFWKKSDTEAIEFVKHFRTHLGNIQDLRVSWNGELCCSISNDKSLKVFDVINFDMINMMQLPYVPRACSWIYCTGEAVEALAVCEEGSGKIYIYDGRASDNTPLKVLDKIHSHPVSFIRFNPVYEIVVSVDDSGILEYWTGPKHEYSYPKTIGFESKLDTDLFTFCKHKTVPLDVAFSPSGHVMATWAADRKVRLFKFATGKLTKVIDESLQNFTELQRTTAQVPNMEFGKRMAVERELEKAKEKETFKQCNIIFDESGNFLLYGTMLGIKVINLVTNRCVRIIGKPENSRFVHVALLQGGSEKKKGMGIELAASDNPVAQISESDPLIVCTAFKKSRFYLFTKREPIDTSSAESDRDIFNEKPSKEELAAATQETLSARLASSATIHTTMGDIHLKLFHQECKKTVENFSAHSRNGYYNGHLFHRIIKGFMIQTGDPEGNGTGGESIWGGEFEDEFHPSLRHDRPYTVSMANAGANTNGSQFFITLAPTPWLDNKHTVFARVTKGMEIVNKIGNMKTFVKTDKPHDDISIVNISVKN